MKSIEEIEQYRRLRAKMKSKCDAQGVSWATYYANLLELGGMNPEVYLRNFFNDDIVRFNHKQLAIIYNDLEEHKDIHPFTQCEMQNSVMEFVTKLGKMSESMQKAFDDVDEVTKSEIMKVLPYIRDIHSLSELFYLRAEETKAQG